MWSTLTWVLHLTVFSRTGHTLAAKLCMDVLCQPVAQQCRFNDVRNQKPYLAKYRWQNIGWYFYEAMATGWLWGAKPLARKIASVRVSLA